MKRSIYETPHDKLKEKRAMMWCEHTFGCATEKAKDFASFDFSCERHGKIVSLVEFRWRKESIEYYPTTYLSLEKGSKLTSISCQTGYPIYFLVRFDGCMALHFLKDLSCYEVGMSHLTSRGDPNDDEHVLLIPNNEFIIYESESYEKDAAF